MALPDIIEDVSGEGMTNPAAYPATDFLRLLTNHTASPREQSRTNTTANPIDTAAAVLVAPPPEVLLLVTSEAGAKELLEFVLADIGLVELFGRMVEGMGGEAWTGEGVVAPPEESAGGGTSVVRGGGDGFLGGGAEGTEGELPDLR